MDEMLGKPVARCTTCGHPTHSLLDVNQRCNAVRNERRCRGIWRSALRDVDWDKCPKCRAVAPAADAAACARCGGTGWIHAAPRDRAPYPAS